MLQLGGKADLAKKSLGAQDSPDLGVGDLYRDSAIVLAVVSQVNRGCATPTQLTDDLVGAHQ